jgi:acyl carrier protein phosphodiesterase
MNEIIGFAAVIVSIFAGMLFNSSRFNAIDAHFSAIDARLDRMQADLSQFYRDLGRHDAKIETLEKKTS